jgi:hypothetical protein
MLGFLGNMTSAPCCVTMGSAELLRFLSNATIETEGLLTSSIVTNATMDGRYYGFRTSTDIGSVCVGIRSSEDVVWESFKYRRACVSGYGLLLVGRLSSYREIAWEKHASLYRGGWRQSIIGATAG